MKSTRIVVATGLGLLLASGAAGQDALGAGDALDANLNVTGTGNISARRIDYRARNNIVTGNVAGGRGFRGSVGYTADTDFRGAVGSDTTYTFRANSLLSAPALANYHDTFDRFSFGQDMALVTFRRDGFGADSNYVSAPGGQSFYDTRLQLDRINSAVSLSETVRAASQPDLLGVTTSADGAALLVRTSPLRGVTFETPTGAGLSMYDEALIQGQTLDGAEADEAGRTFEGRFELLREHTPVDNSSSITPNDGTRDGSEQAYLEILQGVVDRYAGEDESDVVYTTLDQQFQRLRERLQAAGQPPADDEPQDADPETTDPGAADPEATDPEATDPNEIDLEAMADALRHGEVVNSFTPADEGRFKDLMNTGEQRLREGEYFLSERYFNRALRFHANHPMATAGLANAQLGAGTYLSSALTLRNLFTSQPEMIDVRYDADLLPNRTRLFRAIDTLRERAATEQDQELYAFLLAYVGHQTEDQALVEEGLEMLENAAPDDTLLPLLRGVWLDEAEEPVK